MLKIVNKALFIGVVLVGLSSLAMAAQSFNGVPIEGGSIAQIHPSPVAPTMCGETLTLIISWNDTTPKPGSMVEVRSGPAGISIGGNASPASQCSSSVSLASGHRVGSRMREFLVPGQFGGMNGGGGVTNFVITKAMVDSVTVADNEGGMLHATTRPTYAVGASLPPVAMVSVGMSK